MPNDMQDPDARNRQRTLASGTLTEDVGGHGPQQAALGRVGRAAMTKPTLQAFLDKVVAETRATLGRGLVCVMELQADGLLALRAGRGWNAGSLAPPSSPPPSVRRKSTDDPVPTPALLRKKGIVGGMSVVVQGREAPWGVLSVHTAGDHEFTLDDVRFLQSLATLVAVAIELSNQREDIDELVAARTKDLEEARREHDALHNMIGHELRSPMRTVAGFSDIVLAKYAKTLPPQAQELLVLLGKEANQMGDLVKAVLALSNIARTEVDPVQVDLSALAQGILGETCKGSKTIWNVQPGLHVLADAAMIRVVMTNLIINAQKFTGKVKAPEIRVFGSTQGRLTTICVQDNGVGFDMSHMAELFQPFHRLHHPNEFEGKGTGLATVQRIIRRLGGTVSAAGTPGKGAQFSFVLPAADARLRLPSHNES